MTAIMTKEKNASETYQKITQLEHILKRPDTYIGSVEMQDFHMWVHDAEMDCMVEKQVNIVPGLFKIFDEIIVNAADNKVRDPSMKKIEVVINREENYIEVKNDGNGIPIEVHAKEGIYIPELIFGHLLTSSNYDDNEKKVTGGRNGYGAKLCNIFSTEFILETSDPKSGQKYVQKWESNMNVCHPPKITSYKKGPSYTKITFKPDLQRFGMEVLDDDILGVMRRRVYDINGSVRDVNVSLNGKSLKIRNFKSYMELYMRSLEKKRLIDSGMAPESASEKVNAPTILYEKVNDRWELGFAVSDISFQQISFVNSIATTSGGTHVNYLTDQIVKKVSELLSKKKKTVKPFQIRNNIFIFINCLIENPAFTSQTKEQLTTRVRDFGSKCEVSSDFINKIMKTELATKIFEIADENAAKLLKQTDGTRKNRITDYPKLEDANKAGTKEGHKCTLVLTEGDSALSLAVAGLSVVGRDYYGCFPLKGKILNVRDASVEQIRKNTEIQAIKKIMGLQHKKQYTIEDMKTLRYGHVMIMTDQDHDGSHIKGLLINFFESTFPGLLDIPGFLIEFITPIMKVTILKPKKQVIPFYNLPDYEKWRDTESHKYVWKTKYYKGLGTSSFQEAREYFSALDVHIKKFHSLNPDDSSLIDLAFSKKKADDRKEWLRQYEPGTVLDPHLTEIQIGDFINKELILFSLADNLRSIPHLLDGLKPSQRKVIFGSFKRNIMKTEIKVQELAAYVSGQTAYHHTEQSLVQTIVSLAQDFVGANNIYLLMPRGAFGTRATGGKDAAAARYIFTQLNSISKHVFNPLDNPLLTYVQDDEKTVEPEWYVPALPMVLVNGAEGIGTGWSTSIPPFNPIDIVNNLRKLMRGDEPDDMAPWFRGWNGTMQKIDAQRYRIFGRIEQVGENTVEITELPARTWTTTIKEHLLLALSGNERTKPWVKDMQEQHGATIKFVVTLTPEEMERTRKIGFYERFKLISTVSLSNMVLFDAHNKIKKYNDVKEILTDFFYVRLEFYQKRKDYMIERLQWQLEKLSFQVKFIKMIIDEELRVTKKARSVLMKELESLGFPRVDAEGKPHFEKIDEDLEEMDASDPEEFAEELDEQGGEVADENVVVGPLEKFGTYEYLLGMKIWSLTKEKYERLLREKQNKEAELQELLGKSAKDLWNADLDMFVREYEEFIKYDTEVRDGTIRAVGSKVKGKKRAHKDDDDYNPSKKKPAKSSVKKLKTEQPVERILLEPPTQEQVKKPAKVKTETNVSIPKQTPTPKSKSASASSSKVPTPLSKQEPEAPSTIFDAPSSSSSTPVPGHLDIFSKFRKASSDFDKPFVAESNEVAEKPSGKAKRQTTPAASKLKPAAKKIKTPALDESESDFDLDLSDSQPAIAPRSRASRAVAKKPTYVVDLSDDSFVDGDAEEDVEEPDTDESFQASD
ncbi:AER410Wp [Eremothecium gossypii ATCC 10895]|uniref:DNA topoisomerase 2 n=1 Tax=Eremothecium gossypii (strain ATCC 10895 / CBS 109.51 / FGSC 9923 / NRRL Y-1056) TaxID=284811 RepID=Q755V8_EREGS|nr:AER410Wp [Eremothecium gossypii ATCC 10895]AAS53089.1 AER410Wp [Eremothecium gossypii ATCC 10895]AEY97398.1 FAER410Wp [Eremothecium gossypii FDAG1]